MSAAISRRPVWRGSTPSERRNGSSNAPSSAKSDAARSGSRTEARYSNSRVFERRPEPWLFGRRRGGRHHNGALNILDLVVVARSSSFAYQGKAVDVRQVGKELGVDYVVEGSVRKDGDKLRIVAQLIDAKTGEHIWAERFDRSDMDPWALQDEITGMIVSAMTGKRAH